MKASSKQLTDTRYSDSFVQSSQRSWEELQPEWGVSRDARGLETARGLGRIPRVCFTL